MSSIACLTPPGCCRYPSGMLSLPLRDVVATPPGCCRQPSGMLSSRLIVSVSGVAGSEATRDTRHPTLSRNPATTPETCQPLDRRSSSGAAQEVWQLFHLQCRFGGHVSRLRKSEGRERPRSAPQEPPRPLGRVFPPEGPKWASTEPLRGSERPSLLNPPVPCQARPSYPFLRTSPRSPTQQVRRAALNDHDL